MLIQILQMAILAIPLLVVEMPRAYAETNATRGFQKLQNLAGDWEGKDEQGNVVTTNFKLVVSDTVLLETLLMSEKHEMLTIYGVDGDAIALQHYCPTNNRPRMRAIPPEGEIKELVFEFQQADNLPSMAIGHEHRLVIRFDDRDHITERWTWRQDGNDTEMVFRFIRKPRKPD